MTTASRGLLWAAYGWLTAGGVLHFAIDVISQYLRGKRVPGAETTLYYGMNSAYAFGQVLFGVVGLGLCWRAATLAGGLPFAMLSLVAVLGWLAIGFLFIEYWEPKFGIAVFGLLIVARLAIA